MVSYKVKLFLGMAAKQDLLYYHIVGILSTGFFQAYFSIYRAKLFLDLFNFFLAIDFYCAILVKEVNTVGHNWEGKAYIRRDMRPL